MKRRKPATAIPSPEPVVTWVVVNSVGEAYSSASGRDLAWRRASDLMDVTEASLANTGWSCVRVREVREKEVAGG